MVTATEQSGWVRAAAITALLAGGCAQLEHTRAADDDAATASDAELDGGRDGDGAAWPEDDGGVEPGSDLDGGVAEDAAQPDAGPAQDAGLGPTCPSYRFRHLQASMQRSDSVAQRRASIDAAFDAGAHTISWTEIQNIEAVRRIDGRRGWATFWPSGRAEVLARNAVPISWRTDTFELQRGRTWQASSGMAGVSPSRWVTRVWLRHRASGRIQSRLAHHSVSGVDGAGKPPVEWRRMVHAQNIAKFREVMRIGSVPVIGSADFNTTRLRSLLGPSFLYDVPSSGGSHGRRLIDWIVRRPHPELRRTGVRFMALGTSDHRGVRAAYAYTPPCGG